MNFCCKNMVDQIRRQDNPEPNDEPASLAYDAVERMFGCYITRKETLLESCIEPISYCPFCGAKLPVWLYDEYIGELEKSLSKEQYEKLFYYKEEGSLREIPVLDRNKIPEEFKEFKTDEWWIKRGL